MQIASVKISNILSIEDVSVTFGTSGLVLLDGWNYDDDKANGAGKTAIFNALSFGLYGKMPRNITATEILRAGTKLGFVEVTVQANNKTYLIRRERPIKTAIYVDGTDTAMTQEELEAHLGLTYTQFLTLMYAAQSGDSNFLALTDTDKKLFLLRLMDMESMDICHKNVSAQIKALERKLVELQSREQMLRAEIKWWGEPTELSSAEIRAQIAQLRARQEANQAIDKTRKDMMERIVRLKGEIDLAGQRAEILRERKQQKVGLVAEIRALKEQIDQSVTTVICDACGHENKLIDSETERFLKGNLISKTKQLKQLIADIENSNDVVSVYKQRLTDMNLLKQEYSELPAAPTDAHTIASQLEDLSSRLQLAEIGETKVAELQKAYDEVEQAIAATMSEASILTAVEKLYSPTGVTSYVIGNVIELINANVSAMLREVWPSVSYEMTAFREKKDGTTSAKISENLSINSRTCSIGSLSGGEYRCLALIVNLAIVKTIREMFGLTVNPLILDEQFNGLDAIGRERIATVLRDLSQEQEIWVIDHATEFKLMFDRTVKVCKQDQISKIEST